MTTKKEQEESLTNLRRSKVSELLSRGYTNQAEISRILNVHESTISRDVSWFREQAKENFSTYLQEKLPEEFDKAITTFEYVIRSAANTAETTHDDRIKLQALHEVQAARTAKMDMISNLDVMTYQVSKQMKQKEKDSQSSDSNNSEQELSSSEQDYDSNTEEEQEQEEENTHE